jgi:2-polyprenyl-3-methyl-5-hydroxy-6-metoxy-1,4-benzoquinol methylase
MPENLPLRSSSDLAIVQSLGASSSAVYEQCLTLLHKLPPSSSILDFGAGKGNFLHYLKTQNFKDIAGADIMGRPDDLDANIPWFQADLNTGLNIQREFDVIVALEVIEHLENPRHMVRSLVKILRPGGMLILSTPNNGSIRSLLSLMIHGHFVSFLGRDYPAHITALTKLDLSRIATEAGLVEVRFDFTRKGQVPGLRGITWQQLSATALQGERFSDNIFLIAKKL